LTWEDEMIETLRRYQQRHGKEIEAILQEHEERYRVCESDFSLVLFYAAEGFSCEDLEAITRRKDSFRQLEENLLLFVFDGARIGDAIVAAEKILAKLKSKYRQDIYVAAAERTDMYEGSSLIRHLFTVMEFAVEHGHRGEVIDDSYLDGVY
jgi:hypothetical protein